MYRIIFSTWILAFKFEHINILHIFLVIKSCGIIFLFLWGERYMWLAIRTYLLSNRHHIYHAAFWLFSFLAEKFYTMWFKDPFHFQHSSSSFLTFHIIFFFLPSNLFNTTSFLTCTKVCFKWFNTLSHYF